MTDPITQILGPGAEIRRETMDGDLRAIARSIFTKFPRARSVMVGFGQYWADEADDAVHDHVIASDRETPLWPHACDVDFDEDHEPVLAGEYCYSCASGFPYMSIDDNGSAIAGFEMFCTEDGSQEEPAANNYRPYAVARRIGESEEVAIEIVGIARRRQVLGMPEVDAAPFDARGEALLAEIATHAADDGPRQVLADHLIERGDARGELLALELATHALTPEASARRRALADEHYPAALGPLGAVILSDGARFARGFLVEALVATGDKSDVARVRGSRAWRTLEILRYLPESLGVLDREMHALREVHALAADDVSALVASRWAIETLGCTLDDDLDAGELARATTLPALRHLILGGSELARDLGILAGAPFWRQLAQITLLDRDDQRAALRAHPALARVPRLAWASTDDDEQLAGWQQTFVAAHNTVEISLAGWNATASIEQLVEIVRELRADGRDVRLVPTRYWTPAADDLAAILTRIGS